MTVLPDHESWSARKEDSEGRDDSTGVDAVSLGSEWNDRGAWIGVGYLLITNLTSRADSGPRGSGRGLRRRFPHCLTIEDARIRYEEEGWRRPGLFPIEDVQYIGSWRIYHMTLRFGIDGGYATHQHKPKAQQPLSIRRVHIFCVWNGSFVSRTRRSSVDDPWKPGTSRANGNLEEVDDKPDSRDQHAMMTCNRRLGGDDRAPPLTVSSLGPLYK